MDISKPADLCLLLILGIVGLLALWTIARFLRIWIMALILESDMTFFELIGMRLRKVDPGPILVCKMMLRKNGCIDVSNLDFEAHVHSGGSIEQVTRAIISAKKAGLELDWNTVCEMDRRGVNLVDYVKGLSKGTTVVTS